MAEWIVEIDKKKRTQITKCMLIRCKDCRHGRLFDGNLIDCELNELAKEADFFCADGELKDG